MTLSDGERARRIGAAIKRYRDQAGMTQREVIAAGFSRAQSTLSSYEKGTRRPTADDLAELDRILITGGALTDLWHSMNRLAGYASWFVGVVEVERESIVIREYAPLYVPGLLQTEGYASAVLSHGPKSHSPEETAEQLEGRMERQRLLTSERCPQLQFVVEEHVLRRPVGGRDVLCAQLGRILELAASPRVTVQVIPMNSVEHHGLDGGFLIFRHPEKGTLAYTETRYSSDPSDEQEVVEGYQTVWANLMGSALPSEASISLISSIREEMELQ
ncbi:helix-turn-helix transcriptional regulator [Nocardiopsis sp. NPDC049922]|uniref:helix-turn-helix domain-containing protein n=1 Tax=Nocardiopsis sp. NPDC049922 TaxID=3155157 RepID=UPI0033F02B42